MAQEEQEKAGRLRTWRARLASMDIVRVWSSPPDAPLLRRPTDILLLGLSLLLLAGLILAAPGPTAFDDAIAGVLVPTASFLATVWSGIYDTFLLWALFLVPLVLVPRRRRRLIIDLAIAVAVATGLGILATVLGGGSAESAWQSLTAQSTAPAFIAMQVAIATSMIAAASPMLTRPLRYFGRGLIAAGATACIALGMSYPIGVVAGLAVGVLAAAVSHLLRGTPQGHLTVTQSRSGLADIGVQVTDVAPSAELVAGEELLVAARDGEPDVLVKIYGRDSWDSQFVGSLWTAATRRGESVELGRGRLSRVEHEAYLTLLAQRAGVSVLPIVAAGRTSHGDAVVVTEAPAAWLADLDADDITSAGLDECWHALLTLHGAGIAHHRIDRHHLVRRQDGSMALADFAGAEVAAADGDFMADRARLLVTTALAAGHERAVGSAAAALGADGLAEVLPYLQPAVLDARTRRAIHDRDWSLDELRTSAVSASGVEPPPLQQLQRVTPKSIATIVLVALLAYFLVSSLSGVDLASIVAALQEANYAYLLLALAMSPFIQTAMAFATTGATTRKLRYVPVLMLEYAIQFLALCLPSTAAKLALEIRFFERFGIPAAAAVSIGMIDSVSGFAIQIALLVLISVSGLPGLTSTFRGDESTTDSTTTTDTGPSLLAVVLVVGVVMLVVTLVVPRLRARLLGRIPRLKAQALEQSAAAKDSLGVLKHPTKVGTMLLGNLGSQVLQAIILGVCLAAFGETAHLSQLILINTAVSLFGGLMPVPGNIGVAEAGYTAGLQAIGIPAPIAVSTAIAFRVVTFYVPPVWGSLALRWMRRRDYL
jgi:uncharacterized membrane protein YbhN (UPF0104 family)